MPFKIEVEQEVDGRWIAEVMDIPGVLTPRNQARARRTRWDLKRDPASDGGLSC
ncbi:MAG TPA: hypothetical protein VL334_04985 [Anaerolineae bacterium]|nr:hypothetical protein [Anaerolineae bacterium]